MNGPVYLPKVSFSAGELAPAMYSRFDMTQYDVGLRTLHNFIVHPHGGASNRPGTEIIAEVKDSSKAVRLIPFERDIDTAYVLELGDGYARFYNDDGQLVHTTASTSAWVTSTAYALGAFVYVGTTVYRCILGHTSGSTSQPGVGASWTTYWVADDTFEVVMPYTEAQIWDVGYAQSADVLFMAHQDVPLKTLSHSSPLSWAVASYAWEFGPFEDENTGSGTLTLSAYMGSTGAKGDTVTVTASPGVFSPGDVGRWIRIRYIRPASDLKSGEINMDPSKTEGPWSVDGNFEARFWFDSTGGDSIELQYSVDGGSTWSTYKVINEIGSWTTYTGELRAEDFNDVTPKLRMYCPADSDPTNPQKMTLSQLQEERYGYLQIKTYISSTSVGAECMNAIPYLGKATKLWALGAFGTVPGHPKRVGFYKDRLALAATEASPNKVWFSKTGDYPNFGTSLPLVDDDGITVPVLARRGNAITSITPGKFLLTLTGGGTWGIAPGASSDTFKHDSVRVETQEGWGASDIQPVVIGDSVIYLQQFQSRVRDMGYTLEKDGYKGNDLSILSQHLFSGYTIVDWAYQEEPWSILWCVRSDGQLLGLTYMKEHNVFAWHRHDTDGIVESVATIPNVDLGQNDLWLVVRRTINGVSKRFIERLHQRVCTNLEDAWFVDCGAEYQGASTTTITGLTHLVGETVSGLADGFPFSGKVVNPSGEITLDTAASHVIAGLPYTCEFETLDLHTDLRSGSTVGRKKSVGNLFLRLLDTAGGEIGPDSTHTTPILYPASVGLVPPSSFSGDTDTLMPSTWETAGRIYVRQDEPLPITIAAMIPNIAFGG